jgi:hypothetical protein
MNHNNSHKCAAVSGEDLLLFAYGEGRDPRIEQHVRECDKCRDFLAGLDRVRKLAAAGMAEPDLKVTAGLKQTAAHEAELRRTIKLPSRKTGRSPERRRGLGWAAAIAACVIVLLVVAAARSVIRERAAQKMMAQEQRALLLADVGPQLSRLETLIGDSVESGNDGSWPIVSITGTMSGDSAAELAREFSLDPGAWDLIVETDNGVDDLELAMSDLEYQPDLLGYSNDNGDEDKVNLENMERPLVPGPAPGASL